MACLIIVSSLVKDQVGQGQGQKIDIIQFHLLMGPKVLFFSFKIISKSEKKVRLAYDLFLLGVFKDRDYQNIIEHLLEHKITDLKQRQKQQAPPFKENTKEESSSG